MGNDVYTAGWTQQNGAIQQGTQQGTQRSLVILAGPEDSKLPRKNIRDYRAGKTF